MTLIVSVATQECVFQAADRRLISMPKGEVCNEQQNKIVFFEGRLSLAYTGLAFLEGKRTDDWLANILLRCPSQSLPSALERIRNKATLCFKSIQLDSKLKRHAFSGVGWTEQRNSDHLRPLLCWVSNFHDEHGKALHEAKEEFCLGYLIPRDNVAVAMMEFGCPMKQKLRRFVYKSLRSAARKRIGPKAFIRILIDAIRSVSNSNIAVGKSLLVVSVPQIAVNPGRSLLIQGTEEMVASFEYVPENGDSTIIYGPTVVFSGGAIMSDYTFTPGVKENSD